jgi:hypothetical protein
MKQLLTEWRKFIKEQEEAESPKTKEGDLIVSLVADPDKTPKASGMSPENLGNEIKVLTAVIESEKGLKKIKDKLFDYYESPAILNKINKKAKDYSKRDIKKYLRGQVNKIMLLSIFGPTSIDQLNSNSEYRLAIKKFRQSPTTLVFIPTRIALSDEEPLLVLVNPIGAIETDIESIFPTIIQAIQKDINTTLAKTSRKMKKQFETLPDDKVLMLLKNAMLKQDMFDNKGSLNKKGKEFIEKITTRPEITDLIKLRLKSEEVLGQIFDALKDEAFLTSLEKNLVQITKADQGEEEVATA